jgi:hypothetical protein
MRNFGIAELRADLVTAAFAAKKLPIPSYYRCWVTSQPYSIVPEGGKVRKVPEDRVPDVLRDLGLPE